MRFSLSRTALLLCALCAAAPAFAAPTCNVRFKNASGPSGLVDVYVDGRLVFDNVFPEWVMLFPREMTGGQREVVITPYTAPLGQRDLLKSTLAFPESGTHTLTLSGSAADPGPPLLELNLTDDARSEPQ